MMMVLAATINHGRNCVLLRSPCRTYKNRRSIKINFNFFPTSASSTFDGFGFTNVCMRSQEIVNLEKRLSNFRKRLPTFTRSCQRSQALAKLFPLVHLYTILRVKNQNQFFVFLHFSPLFSIQPPLLAIDILR